MLKGTAGGIVTLNTDKSKLFISKMVKTFAIPQLVFDKSVLNFWLIVKFVISA